MALGAELVRRGALVTASNVSDLALDDLAALIESNGPLTRDIRAAPPEVARSAPLPAAFRLTETNIVVPLAPDTDTGGRGAGSGRGTGPVHVGVDDPPAPGDVLVVRTLDPALAGVLPALSGLVAETGTVLSHLAILAREYGVPTVVGFAGATELFQRGDWVLVDGSTGEVSPVDDAEWTGA
jgi:pyruvate,water dikinase